MHAQYGIGSSDYVEAFASVKAAKNVFWWLIAVAIIVQLAAFVLVDFAGVLDGKYATPTATAPATAPADSAQWWFSGLCWILPMSKFIGLVSALLLALTLMFAVKLSLLGRLGGAAGLTSAFFWSLILLAVVTPWQQMFRFSLACGALYNLSELIDYAKDVKSSWGAESITKLSWILYYARFLLYPLIALILWLVVGIKFACGYRKLALAGPTTPQQPPAQA